MTEEAILAGILQREGGYRFVPGDRGGATNFGITQETLGRWRKLNRPATPEEVRALAKEEAEAIYYAQYLAPFGVWGTPPPVGVSSSVAACRLITALPAPV